MNLLRCPVERGRAGRHVDILRQRLPTNADRKVTIVDVGGGPPAAGLEISITGNDYSEIAPIALLLASELASIDGIEDVTSNVSEARDEVIRQR